MPSQTLGGGGWSAEQLRNAGIIYSVGRQMGLGTRDIQIALITAMVESNLINVNYGDRDSLGLFQQRPSQGWGTPEQVTNPQYAARKFYTTLLDLGSRRFQMDMGEAAQAVQRSAYPGRYAERISSMRNLYPQIAKAGGDEQFTVDGAPYDFAAATDLPADIPTVEEMLASTGETNPTIPSASAMLGAWGMNNPPIQEDPFEDGSLSFLSDGTNQLLTEWREVEGGYTKGVDGWRKAVIDAATSAIGTPYAWGGNSLQNGVDCSGLLQQAFGMAGIQLPRVSYQQAAQGQRVGAKGLRPGDLVAWDNSSRNPGADHIALYIGNGKIIEAARPGTTVRIRTLGPNLEGGFGVSLNF